MTEFLPHIHPDGHVGFECPWCRIQYQVLYKETFVEEVDGKERAFETISAKCNGCKKPFMVRCDGAVAKVHPRWYVAMMLTAKLLLYPFVMMDLWLNQKFDKLSQGLQRATTFSKYLVALIPMLAGLALVLLHPPLFAKGEAIAFLGCMAWILILALDVKWLIKKARTAFDESGEVVDRMDLVMLNGTLPLRFLCMLNLSLYLALILIGAGGWMLGSPPPEGWLAGILGTRAPGFVLIYIALHFMTASYLPPWHRRLVEFLSPSESQA